MTIASKLIAEYIAFSGIRSYDEIFKLLERTGNCPRSNDSAEDFQLRHIQNKLTVALKYAYAAPGKKIDLVIDPSALAAISKPQLGKFVDTGDVPSGGRQDRYWGNNKPKIQFDPKNIQVRKGSPIPENLDLISEQSITKYFGLRAIEYGQWLTQQDRVNYLAGCGLALLDLQKALGFTPQQIGFFGFVSVAFGARGRTAASAHFEPSTFAINLTRFKRPQKLSSRNTDFDRSALMFGSGGIGSFAHEFGHALDYFSGIFAEPIPANLDHSEVKHWLAASFSASNRTQPIAELINKKTIRGRMEKLLNKIILKQNGTHSDYYSRVVYIAKKVYGDLNYWTKRVELFARAFEVYVFTKMKQKNWYNVFLHEKKYEDGMYMTALEFKPIEKDFDELIQAIRSALRPSVANLTKLLAVLDRTRKPGKGKGKPKNKGR